MSRLFVFIVRFFKLSTTSVSKNFQRARIKDQAWTKLIILLEVVKKRKKNLKNTAFELFELGLRYILKFGAVRFDAKKKQL